MIGVSSGFLVGEQTNFETGKHVNHHPGVVGGGGEKHMLIGGGSQGLFLCFATGEAAIFNGSSQLSPSVARVVLPVPAWVCRLLGLKKEKLTVTWKCLVRA